MKLYEGQVIDNNDPDQQMRVKVRILPEMEGVNDDNLRWIQPFNGNSSSESAHFSLPDVDSFVWVLVDQYWKTFFYVTPFHLKGLFNFKSAVSKLSASEISGKEYTDLDFQLYNDGGISFHNKSTGEHGFIHSSGAYSLFDSSGNIVLNSNGKLIKMNGETKTFVTHAELDTALQTFISALNAQLLSISAGATSAIGASGLWTTPLTLGNLTLNIANATTTTIKTGG